MSDILPITTTVLITGSRHFNQDAGLYLDYLIQNLPDFFNDRKIRLIHGAAAGADTKFAQNAEMRGWETVGCAPDWKKYGKRAGPIRNSELVAQDPDLAVVMLASDSKGTKDCYNKLLKHRGRLEYILLVTEEEVTLINMKNG